VEDERHCEFVYLRDFLTRTHLQDLIETTSQIHYEGKPATIVITDRMS
jgi:septin 3/9/12